MRATNYTKLVALPLGAALVLGTGCATKASTGTAVGAGGGALLGGAVGGKTGMLVGAALGGLLGYSAGRQMDKQDERRAALAFEQNREMQWTNPETGAYYEVEPTQTISRGGRECREFRMTADVGGRPDEIYGTACRNPDGTWEVLSG